MYDFIFDCIQTADLCCWMLPLCCQLSHNLCLSKSVFSFIDRYYADSYCIGVRVVQWLIDLPYLGSNPAEDSSFYENFVRKERKCTKSGRGRAIKKLCMPGFELQTFGDESDSSVPLSLLFNDCLLHGLILHQNYR